MREEAKSGHVSWGLVLISFVNCATIRNVLEPLDILRETGTARMIVRIGTVVVHTAEEAPVNGDRIGGRALLRLHRNVNRLGVVLPGMKEDTSADALVLLIQRPELELSLYCRFKR